MFKKPKVKRFVTYLSINLKPEQPRITGRFKSRYYLICVISQQLTIYEKKSEGSQLIVPLEMNNVHFQKMLKTTCYCRLYSETKMRKSNKC